MNDTLKVVRDRILELGYTDVHTRRLDRLTGKYGIVVRPGGASTVERYQDRTCLKDVIVHVMVRRESEEEAMTECMDIASSLEGESFESSNGSYEYIGSELYTEAQELELGESNVHTWDFRLVIQLRETKEARFGSGD